MKRHSAVRRRLPLLIGQAPSSRGGGRSPFDCGRTGSGTFLNAVAGINVISAVDAVNLLRRFPGKEGKGDAFPAAAARKSAARMLPGLAGRPIVLLAGKRVAAAFGVRRLEYFREFRLGASPAAIIPHPSGVNRWWNDAGNRRRASLFLRAFFGTAAR